MFALCRDYVHQKLPASAVKMQAYCCSHSDVRHDHLRISRMLLEKLRLLECSLHGDRRNDREWLELILHPAFREITRSGVMVNRSETITALLSEKDEPFILSSDFRLTEMGCGSALLHYRTFCADGSHPSLRSSYWICSDEGQWMLFFHQGTPAAGTEVHG